MKVSFDDGGLRIAMGLLADAAGRANSLARPSIGRDICSAVATMISASGPHGGIEQTNMMKLVELHGFTPYYYANTIRVEFK